MPLTRWSSDTSAAPGEAGWELTGMTGMGQGCCRAPGEAAGPRGASSRPQTSCAVWASFLFWEAYQLQEPRAASISPVCSLPVRWFTSPTPSCLPSTQQWTRAWPGLQELLSQWVGSQLCALAPRPSWRGSACPEPQFWDGPQRPSPGQAGTPPGSI